jgi:hypothetical protein
VPLFPEIVNDTVGTDTDDLRRKAVNYLQRGKTWPAVSAGPAESGNGEGIFTTPFKLSRLRGVFSLRAHRGLVAGFAIRGSARSSHPTTAAASTTWKRFGVFSS